MRLTLPICLCLAVVGSTGCASDHKKVEQATEAGESWAATAKTVAEQWAQSRVSLRFTRTTLNTAVRDLARRADSIRSIDPAAARRLDRLTHAIEPVRAAVAMNEPDQARDAARLLTAIMQPEPVSASARPAAVDGGGR